MPSVRQDCGVGEVEEPLAGGMDSGGSVVRVGDTVRRPIKPQVPAAAVRELLVHLEEVGFDGAPRFLGMTIKAGRCCPLSTVKFRYRRFRHGR